MFRKISKRFKNQLWYTYTLLVFEFTCQSITPWLLGKAIDSLLQKQNEMFFLYTLCCITGLIVGTSRRIYDTKVFTGILRDTSIDVTKDMFERDVEPSKIPVRIDRLTRFTEFFEYNLPQYVKSFVQIIVSSIVLFSNIHHFIWIIALIMSVSLLCSYHASQKSGNILKQLQTQDEIKQTSIINKRPLEEINESFFKIQKFHVNKSNIDALNWSVYDICCILCELLALYVLASSTQTTAGQITASLMYVASFTGYFSVFTHAFVSIKELKVTEASLERD
jgi:ABC-type multidrug transport system fused ATPase/permease subunit